MDARRRQHQQPADIRRCDKMPGGTHHMRAQDLPFIEGFIDCGICRSVLHPLAKRPFCPRIILGLDRAKPLHDLVWLGKFCLGEQLVMESDGEQYLKSYKQSTFPNSFVLKIHSK